MSFAATRERGARGPRVGMTLIEIAFGVTVLTMILAAIGMTMVSGSNSSRSSMHAAELNADARRLLDRVARDFISAGRLGLFPEPLAPFGSSELNFQQNQGYAHPDIVWGPNVRIRFQLDPSELDDGLDNNGNGLIDEGMVVRTIDPGGANEREVVLGRGVRALLEGEIQNGADDNGNGLIDEQGLCFVIDGDTLTIRLTLERRDHAGRVLTRTVQTSVNIRN